MGTGTFLEKYLQEPQKLILMDLSPTNLFNLLQKEMFVRDMFEEIRNTQKLRLGTMISVHFMVPGL